MATIRHALLLATFGVAVFMLAALQPNQRLIGDASQGQTLIWGDADCSGQPNGRDVALQLRGLTNAQQYSQTEPCPDLGTTGSLESPDLGQFVVGDLLCDGSLDVVDALALGRVVTSQSPLPARAECPHVGDSVTIVQTPESPTPTASPGPVINAGREVHVSISLRDAPSPVGAFYAKIHHDRRQSYIYSPFCLLSGMQCGAFMGGDLVAVGASPQGFANGELFYFTIYAGSDVPVDVETLTLVDTEGNPVAGTITAEPAIARVYIKGDANCNGSVYQGEDLMPFLDQLAGRDESDCANRARPGSNISHPQDTDCNGAITANDFLLILRYFADVPMEVAGCDSIGT